MPLFFWSGLSNVSDLTAATRNGIAAGVVATELSANGRKLAVRHLEAGYDLFVDSGAFGAFMGNLKGRGTGECDWARVFGAIEPLVNVTHAGRLAVVAPDKIGDQSRTLALLREHRDRIASWAVRGVQVLVPHQRGARSLVDFGRQVAEVLRGIDYTPALPCKAKAATPAEVLEFVAALRPARLHLLGAGRSNVWRKTIRALEAANPGLALSHDANRLRSLLGEGRALTSRVRAQSELLADDAVRGLGALAHCDETELPHSLLNERNILAALPDAVTSFLSTKTGIAAAELRLLDLQEPDDEMDAEHATALGRTLARACAAEDFLWSVVTEAARVAATTVAPRLARIDEIGHAHRGDDGVHRYASEAQADLFAA
jgi:hypothetical protein